MVQVLIAHAEGEERLAERIAEPLQQAGYEVIHHGTLFLGESLAEKASQAISQGCPIVLCGTVAALGTGWAHRLVHAAKIQSGARVFALQMDEKAYLDMLTLDSKIARFWLDPNQAISELIEALAEYYPAGQRGKQRTGHDLERRYREVALKTCDIVDLANLPISDRDLATKELLLRSLYVSLRVGVDIPPGTESQELDTKLQDIEGRRKAPDGARGTAKRFSVGERLQASKRLVVLGDPGAGKSTMLRWIATAYLLRMKADPDWNQLPDAGTLPDTDWLPLLIRCREIDESKDLGSLEEIIRQHLRNYQFSDRDAESLAATLLDAIRDGRVLLLFDGLDEISHPALRAKFCRHIEQVHIAYPESSIIVTSRIVGYREMGVRITRGFEHVTVLDLTPEDKNDFAHRWCTVTEPMMRRESAARELITDIHSTDRIERLTGNPMLLTTMALVKKKVGKLPSHRADLYREAVDVLLNWRIDVDERLDRHEALPQLQYPAYVMCDAGVQQLREDEVVETLERMREEFPTVRAALRHSTLMFLRLLERRTGILVESGHTRHNGRLVPVFEFRHLTFQEYLAGLALVERRFPGRDRRKPLADQVAVLAGQTAPMSYEGHVDAVVTENWREAIRLCVMSCNDDEVDDILRAIVLPPEGEQTDTTARARAVLACSCLSDEPNVGEETALEVIERFIDEVTETDANSFVGRSAADAAIKEVADSLWGAVLSRRVVARCLSAPEEFERISGVAATVLGASVPSDRAELENWVRNQTALLVEPQAEVAIEAALALMEAAYRDTIVVVPDLVPRLTALLTRGPCEANAAAWALRWARTTNAESGAWTPTEHELDALAEAIATIDLPPSAMSRLLTCFDAAAGQRHPDVAPRMIEHFASATPSLRGLLVEHYATVFPEAIDPVLSMLHHPDDAVHRSAVLLLAQMHHWRAVEPLLEQLAAGKDDYEVHAAVVLGLGRLGDRRAVKPLLEQLAGAPDLLQVDIAEALGALGDERAVEPLLSILTDPDGIPRTHVVQALARIGDPQAVEPLRAHTRSGPSDLLTVALALLGDADAQHAVQQAMTDESAVVRRDVLWSLASLETDRTLRVLLSRDHDAIFPGIDPAEEVSESVLEDYAKATRLSVDEVRARYEELSERYGLRLSWSRRPSVA
ncbi:HEAT repeat domain-containing protein [Streptomyces sp. NPDC012510]|uniref:HEAT repeat domain-containing protein n=1 Tax=Streptomyces sp. NPDC012510 TaxID=3364838 RepID=UPI0036E508E5